MYPRIQPSVYSLNVGTLGTRQVTENVSFYTSPVTHPRDTRSTHVPGWALVKSGDYESINPWIHKELGPK